MINKSLIILTIIILFFSCQSDTTSDWQENIEEVNSSLIVDTTQLFHIIYMKEKEFEILSKSGNEIKSKFKSKINFKNNLPIGEFNYNKRDENIFQLKFPNEYYTTKLEAVRKNSTLSFQNEFKIHERWQDKNPSNVVYIFPSKKGKKGNFNSCYRCPYWMKEMYTNAHYKWDEIFN